MSGILKFIFKKMAKKSLPLLNGEIKVDGLQENVEIYRDKWGIPHIFAENESDLYFAQGFIHAQDRLWQMELHRRLPGGRLSEVFGEDALDTDRATRTLGFRRVGEQDFQILSNNIKSGIISYTNGVNAYLNHKDFKLPLEFKLVKFKPEPWTTEDTMTFGRFMQWQLSGQFHYKIFDSLILNKIGLDKLKEIEPEFSNQTPSTLPNGIEFNIYTKDGKLKAFEGPYLKRKGGSNGWAISGKRTSTGKPIHCNDPHLSPSQPPIWYACHLNCPGIDVFGVGPPALPLILIGHNDFCSWGFTVANVDAEDLFIEKINPENSHQYEFMGEWKNVEIIEEKIYIKDKSKPFIEKVIITHHGPIISGIIESPDKTIALQSVSLQSSKIFDGVYKINRSKSWDDFINGVKDINSPQQNLTYADIDGNIGSYICGKIPIRKKGDGTIPVPGWNGEYEWKGFIPFEEKPHSFNPLKGYIVTANNCPVFEKDYQYFLSNSFDPGYRAKRISDLIEASKTLSINDMDSIQTDSKSLAGVEFVEIIKDFSSVDSQINQVVDILKEWDGFMTLNTIGGTIFNVLNVVLLKNIIYPVLGEELGNKLLGMGFHPMLKSTTEKFHLRNNRLFNLLRNPDNSWINERGGLQKVLEKGFKDTINYLREKIGPKPEDWVWGKLNKINYPHAMAVKKPLDKVFNVGPYPTRGDSFTPIQMGSPIDSFATKNWAPSYRQIVDLSDLSNSKFIIPPGQSGNLASPYYDNLFDLFSKGQYIPMLWTLEQIKKNSENLLSLSKG